MKRSEERRFIERLLFEHDLDSLLLGDYAYTKNPVMQLKTHYIVRGHWVDYGTKKRFRFQWKWYYRYTLTCQRE